MTPYRLVRDPAFKCLDVYRAKLEAHAASLVSILTYLVCNVLIKTPSPKRQLPPNHFQPDLTVSRIMHLQLKEPMCQLLPEQLGPLLVGRSHLSAVE